MAFYFEMIEDIPFLTRKIQKNKFCAFFYIYFQLVKIMSPNMSKFLFSST
jgi:hypothetical protein